jgi:Tol biopolymer transport system component
MSPEQLRGEAIDRRTDVFAFGCVLFECLTGRRAFEGKSLAQTVAAVLEREPELTALPSQTPEALRRLLRRCLAKDPRRRLRDLGDAVIELEDARAQHAQPAPSQRPNRTGWLVAYILGVLLLATIAIALLRERNKSPELPVTVERFSIAYPGEGPQTALAYLRVCLSRDGSKLIAAAADGQQQHLWLRNKGDTSFMRMEDTEGGRLPTLSPDGQWLTFFSDGTMMKRRTSGGQSYRICTSFGWWGSSWWGTDNVITFLPNWGMGLARISAEGGSPKFVTELKPRENEYAQLSPFVLPDNKRVLLTIWDGKQTLTSLKIVALNLDTQERQTVMENASTPRVARTPWGPYLLWCRASTIYAAPFDVAKATVTGPATPIVDGVMTDVVLFVAVYDVADDGTLAYVPGPPFVEQSRLSWLETDGTTKPFSTDRIGFGDPQFSADGNRVLTIVKGQQYTPYLYDLSRNTFAPIITDTDVESACISPDGQKIAYTSNREGPYKLFVRNLSDGHEEKLYEGPGDYQTSLQWSHDGKYITFSMSPPQGVLHDVWYIDLGDRKLQGFANTPAEDRAPKISPDSKWLAYSSDVSGVREVYIRSFPDGKVTKQVTYGGGDVPDWSPDGKTLYFRQKGILYSVPISPADGTPGSKPAIVYSKRFGQADYHMTDYAISPGGRILLIEPSEQGPTVRNVNVVLNWHQLVAPGKP